MSGSRNQQGFGSSRVICSSLAVCLPQSAVAVGVRMKGLQCVPSASFGHLRQSKVLRVFCQRTDCESMLVLSPWLCTRGAVTGSALDKHARGAHPGKASTEWKRSRGQMRGFRQGTGTRLRRAQSHVSWLVTACAVLSDVTLPVALPKIFS